jgi:hypothetical protein
MCWVWVLLYYWLYYCRLLYYVFLVLTLIVFWTFICIFLLHYYSQWNHVKISFWTCYYMSLWSVRYCSVNTETEPKIPKPNFLGTDFWKETIGTYFPRNRISMGTEVPNRSVRYYRMPRLSWHEQQPSSAHASSTATAQCALCNF